MARYEGVVQDPVLILETLEEGVLANGRFSCLKLVIGALTLFVEGVDPPWKATGQAKRLSLLDGESGSLVPSRAIQDGVSSQSNFEDVRGRHGWWRRRKRRTSSIIIEAQVEIPHQEKDCLFKRALGFLANKCVVKVLLWSVPYPALMTVVDRERRKMSQTI